MQSELDYALVQTLFGWTGLALTDQGICTIIMPATDKRHVRRELESYVAVLRDFRRKSPNQPPSLTRKERMTLLRKATRLLRKYFTGERVLFDVPIDLSYYTAFQQAVWRATGRIPYGETRSYAWVAARIGKPKAVRAVGQALGANPIPIIVP